MGLAVDTVAFYKDAAGATGGAAAAVTGDSLTVRNFAGTATAKLIGLFRETGTAGFVQLTSPRLANSTTGIKVYTDESPAVEMYPAVAQQPLYSGDVLTAKVAGKGLTGVTLAGLQVYYSTLTGAAARLHMWGDISGVIANVFTQSVAVAEGAASSWHTRLANHTADLMKADTTYALLGYTTSLAVCMVALRAQETSTLRVAGPGTTITSDTSDYFVARSTKLGLPFIPVVNANNRGNIQVSVIANAATVAAKVSLIWAELSADVS